MPPIENAEIDWPRATPDPDPWRIELRSMFALGTISSCSHPQEYLQIYEGLRVQHQFKLGMESIHFVYRLTKENLERDQATLSKLHEDFPNARFHNVKDMEDTVRFLAASKFLLTSGSGVSFLAVYFCPDYHVVFTTPEQHRNPNTSKDYSRNVYYMDEWVPVHKYIGDQGSKR